MTSILKVDNIQNSSGTSAISIDDDGVVTQPALPAFRVGLTSNQDETSTGQKTVLFDESSGDNTFIQGGMTLSSGVITIPKDGVYQLNTATRVDNVGSGYVQVLIVINGVTGGNADTQSIEGSPPSNYFTLEPSDIYKLSAGDTVEIKVEVNNDTSWRVNASSTFSGALLG